MTIDPASLPGGHALGDLLERLSGVVRPQRIVTGWATVELDRAEAEMVAAHGLAGGQVPQAAHDDEVLGARCRIIRSAAGVDIVLLEPSTEGRLAAALARHGEGTVAFYLLADAAAVARASAAGFAMTAEGEGPFGGQRLILGGPRDGPFALVVGLDDAEPATSPPGPRATESSTNA